MKGSNINFQRLSLSKCIDKMTRVMNSCETLDQLFTGQSYCKLLIRRTDTNIWGKADLRQELRSLKVEMRHIINVNKEQVDDLSWTV